MVSTLNTAARVADRGPGIYGSGVQTITASTSADASFNGKTVVLTAAAGLTITLPASTGSGWRAHFVLGATVTSNNIVIKVANTTDAFVGFSQVVSDNTAAVIGYIASAGSDDTVTLNGTTTGGYIGDVIEVEDIASGTFRVQIAGKATGTEATPFSATV